jgi:hypothetical protein
MQVTVLTADCISGNFSGVQIVQDFHSSSICAIEATADETASEYAVLVTGTPCSDHSSNTTKYIIIGVCLGVVGLMALAAAVTIFCLYKKRKTRIFDRCFRYVDNSGFEM